MNSISISDMQNFVENMGPSDMKMSANIGNVIELDEDLGDDLGIGLLSNRPSSRPADHSSSTHNVSAMEKIDDIGISSLEPLESISFDLPMNQGNSFPEIGIHRDSSDSSHLFSNDQTVSGPSINLAASTRMNPEEERKKKIDLINKLNECLHLDLTIAQNTDFMCDRSMDGTEFTNLTNIHIPSWDVMLAEFAADQDFYNFN